jgi:hypothetical protein
MAGAPPCAFFAGGSQSLKRFAFRDTRQKGAPSLPSFGKDGKLATSKTLTTIFETLLLLTFLTTDY